MVSWSHTFAYAFLGSAWYCWQDWKRWCSWAQRGKSEYKSRWLSFLNRPLYWNWLLSKGQRWIPRLSGTDGTTGLTRLTGTDGTSTSLCVIYVWPVPTHVSTVRTHVRFCSMKGSAWYRGLGWERWETRVAGELHVTHDGPSHASVMKFETWAWNKHLTFDKCYFFAIRENRAHQGRSDPEESQWVSPLTWDWPD